VSETEVLEQDLLAGSVAIVTGAGTGIGRAIALRLGTLGARVIGVGRRAELLAQTRSLGGSWFEPIALDIRDAGAVGELFEDLEHIDLLVNNAGGQFVGPAAEISPRGFGAVLDLNLTAAARLIALARPLMGGGAVVVNVSLSAAERGIPGLAHAATARAAIAGLTRELARREPELRFYCLAPGTVLTDGVRGELTPQALSRVLEATPLGRDTHLEEVAEWVAALAAGIAPGASGALIELDGGSGLSGATRMIAS